MRSDQRSAQYFIGRGLDDGDAVAVEVAGEQFSSVGLECEAHRSPAHIQQGQQFVVLQVNARHLAGNGARDKGLRRIWQDGDVLWIQAYTQSRAHGQASRIDERDRAIRAVGDDHGRTIRRYPRQPGSRAHPQSGHHGSAVQIDNREVGRSGVGHISMVAVGRDVYKIRAAVDPDGCGHFVLLGVNDADVVRSGIDNINFISLWIGRDTGGLIAHR